MFVIRWNSCWLLANLNDLIKIPRGTRMPGVRLFNSEKCSFTGFLCGLFISKLTCDWGFHPPYYGGTGVDAVTLWVNNVFWQLCKHEKMLVEMLLFPAWIEQHRKESSAVHFIYTNSVHKVLSDSSPCIITSVKNIQDIIHLYMKQIVFHICPDNDTLLRETSSKSAFFLKGFRKAETMTKLKPYCIFFSSSTQSSIPVSFFPPIIFQSVFRFFWLIHPFHQDFTPEESQMGQLSRQTDQFL